MTYKYEPYPIQDWFDHIYKVGPDNKPIPKRDASGAIIYNPYTGYPEWEAFEEGSRFTAARMNHIESWLAKAHTGIFEMDKSLKKILAQLVASDRVPGNNGIFADAFDGTEGRLIRLKAMTDVTESITSGTTTIPVADAAQFTAMTYATIFDADSYEHVMITAVDDSANTITVQALTSDYSKGAKVARSTASVDTENQTMDVAPFVTYNIEFVEVI
ncbi:hypothetical protein [Lysinibacillus boronitolerans]|uniref:hypothetical protein n=1 Tax=Lysinibacillus boronitolerans TaxID=309788 RepID=UPI003852D9AC